MFSAGRSFTFVGVAVIIRDVRPRPRPRPWPWSLWPGNYLAECADVGSAAAANDQC